MNVFKILLRRILLTVFLAGLVLYMAIIVTFIQESFDLSPSPLSVGDREISKSIQDDLIPEQGQVVLTAPVTPVAPVIPVAPIAPVVLVAPVAPATLVRVQTNSGLPVRLKIPSLGVDSAIVYVGITSEGAMDVPKDPADAAWFNLGARPGEMGSAVISGHYGWKNNTPAVFDNLYKLQKGDRVYVENDQGVVEAFVVRESRRYDENADASDVFTSYDGQAHLNLITCEGVWNKFSKSYSKRLVVFTDKVIE